MFNISSLPQASKMLNENLKKVTGVKKKLSEKRICFVIVILQSSSSVIAIRHLEIINLLRGYGTLLHLLKLLCHPAPENLKTKSTPEPYILANVMQMEYLKKKRP